MQTREADATFRQQLVKIRRARGLTVRALGAEVGMLASGISKIEAGDRRVTVGEAVDFAQALGVPLDALLTDGPVTFTVTI